jgi:hypothetical protein
MSVQLSVIRPAGPVPSFIPLCMEDRTHVDTACAAYHLGRRPQTMRAWACLGNGPIRPARVNGRLSWPVASIRELLTVALLHTF